MKKIRVFITLSLLALSLIGCGKKNAEEVVVTETPTPTPTETATPTPEPTAITPEVPLEEQIPDGKVKSYLTGEYVSPEIGRRGPIAVSINNVKDAIPSSSLSKAGVIYEAPVEGELTRLMPVFEDYDGLEKIGSVRSCRDYFLSYAGAFDAIYVHYGQCAYALSYFDLPQVNNINGLGWYGDQVFYRTSDRKSPHNAYTSAEGIQKGIETKGFSQEYAADYTPQFQFEWVGNTVNLDNGTDAAYVEVGYPYNKPWFVYNEQEGLYYRYEYGSEQMDDVFNVQLSCKNIIMEYVNWSPYESTQYLNIDTTSGGAGKYITNGKAIDITWTRDDLFGPARYYDADGNEITLNTGVTWVCDVQNDRVANVRIGASQETAVAEPARENAGAPDNSDEIAAQSQPYLSKETLSLVGSGD